MEAVFAPVSRSWPAPCDGEEIIRRPEAIGWKITAEVAGPGLGHEIELTAEPGQPRGNARSTARRRPQTALARLLRIVWLGVPAQDRLWIEGADGRRRFLDRIALSFPARPRRPGTHL